ncbi:MAG: hypothetical protein RBT19_13535 [Tenuifilaceae bacterium]|jgi:hypothetical protein|uniref:hypothetical protein n=1 Tax=Perlabentimonas gracilis TaxID=2715279 RepID=UPI0014096C26|nr:hypothetical protein [Perlabentimonas gracilis]MDX9771377.1 hypothetical protein [Tenuifilaceae bacterium]NHB69607.1 hypothetical protein [Perlabentimonas gracilis]
MKAVVTADIIDYTKLSSNDATRVIDTISSVFNNPKALSSVRTNLNATFSIKRGDSIQVEIGVPEDALKVALLLKTAVNAVNLTPEKKRNKPMVDMRIAIGIGEIDAQRSDVNISSGEAYEHSGRTLDTMKKSKRKILIKTHSEQWDNEINTELALLEEIMKGWKITSAEVLYLTLLGLREKDIEAELGITQSAVNQRKANAGWSGLEALINRFEELISGGN